MSPHRSHPSLTNHPTAEIEQSVVGHLNGIDVQKRRILLRHPHQGGSLTCPYEPQTEPMLVGCRRELIQAVGEIALDLDGAPTHIRRVDFISRVDTSPIELAAFMSGVCVHQGHTRFGICSPSRSSAQVASRNFASGLRGSARSPMASISRTALTCSERTATVESRRGRQRCRQVALHRRALAGCATTPRPANRLACAGLPPHRGCQRHLGRSSGAKRFQTPNPTLTNSHACPMP